MTSKDTGEAYNDKSEEEYQGATAANPDDMRILEALLFASEELMTATRLKAILPNNPDARRIRSMVEKINVQLQKERHPFEIVEIGGGYQFRTITYYHPWVRQIFKEKAVKKLSIQALECLAIIAYKQPLSKAEIEAIRGVVSDGAMKTLLEKRLVTIAGRSEKPGRPLLYATTQSFLKYFGLNKIEDLPRIEEFESIAREKMEDMSLDELNEPDLEVGVEEDNAKETVETPNEGVESSEPSDELNVSDSSVFEVSVDETESPPKSKVDEEKAEKSDETDVPTAEEPAGCGDENNGEENAHGAMVTDKTQVMIRENVVSPVKHEEDWVKGGQDHQEIDMGKTKTFSDSQFDLDVQKKTDTESEEDPWGAEAETITMKAIESDEERSRKDASEEEAENFEVSENAEDTSAQSVAEGSADVDESESEEEADFEVTDTTANSVPEDEKIDDTIETGEDEVFDIDDFSSAIEEVNPEDKSPVESHNGPAENDSGSEIPPPPEESTFVIEVSVDKSADKSSDAATEDVEASFEVGAAAGKEADDEETRETSLNIDEVNEEAASSGEKKMRNSAKGKKDRKKKGK